MNRVSFLFLLVILLLEACQKPQVKPAAKSEVTYKVSSSTDSQASQISYTNESGATITIQNVTLPFSVSFKRPAGAGTSLLQVYITTPTGSAVTTHQLSGEILLDGKLVKDGNSSGEQPVLSLGYVHLP